jgi:pyruvate formate lyase activating enzyme
MPRARVLYGTEYTADELFRGVLADTDFYKASGGGITCSGGEPLMQAEFLADFLSLCKKAGLHTAVDTSGAVPWSKFEKVLPYTDLFLYDIKHMDTQEHKRLTGVGNERILENLQRLCERGAPVEIRIPVIPGLNDGEDNLRQMELYFSTLKTLTAIIPLPYHALSGSKYSAIGKKSFMPEATGEEYAAAQRVSDFFR